MFENTQPKPQINQTPGAGGQVPQSLKQKNQVSPQQPTKGVQVYTMPEKFRPSAKVKKSGSNGLKKWIFVGALIISFFAIIAAIIVYAFSVTSSEQQQVLTTDINTNLNTNVAVNKNENTNESSNKNDNTNSNDNENENTFGSILNIDENINTDFLNDNENDNTNENDTNINAETSVFLDRSDVATARDKDKDKLTDKEEEIYTTKFDKPDSDKDGFIDGSEVLNNFSPVDAEETLLNSGLVIQYENEDFGWTVNYPAEWFADPVDETNTDVWFTSDTVEGEFVQIQVYENTKSESAAEWFASLYTDIDPEDLDEITVAGLEGIVSPDGFTYYIADDLYIIGLIYNFGAKDEIHFQTTFEMMVNNFTYKKKKQAKTTTKEESTTSDNPNENTNSAVNENSSEKNINSNSNSSNING